MYSLDDLSDRTESLLVQKGVANGVGVDEHLGCACVGTSGGKCQRAILIRVGNGIVLEVALLLPLPLDRRVTSDTKLDNEAGHDAEETNDWEENGRNTVWNKLRGRNSGIVEVKPDRVNRWIWI